MLIVPCRKFSQVTLSDQRIPGSKLYPGDHDSRHPFARAKFLQCQRRNRLKKQIWIIKYAQHPSPLLRSKITQLCFDAITLLEIDNGCVADVADVDPHEEVDESIPENETTIELLVS